MSSEGEISMRNVVRALVEAIFPPREGELVVRKVTRDEVARVSAPATIVLHDFGTPLSIVALLPYREPLVQALITEAKFEGNVRAQALLGSALADYIKVWSAGQRALLIPLPLGAKRRKERGYNQVERAALFALKILHADEQLFDITFAPQLLQRVRETKPQTELGRRERLTNMRGAFGSAHVRLDPSLIYVLLDDVTTTGATLAAAHDALVKAGAQHILLLALAHQDKSDTL